MPLLMFIINKKLGIFFLIFFNLVGFAQDTIFFRNAKIELADIQQVTVSQIYYKKYLNTSGTQYIINKYEVNRIKHQNGVISLFDSLEFVNPITSQNKISQIDYIIVKKDYNKLLTYIDNRSSFKNKEQLYFDADIINRLSRHQIATRIGSITFACFTAASIFVLGVDNIITLGNPEDGFFVPPAGFGFFALTFAASNIGINKKLRIKRKAFVTLYNDL